MEKCLLCRSDMSIDFGDETSWWQCRKDRTHRMSLDEGSSFDDGKGGEIEIEIVGIMRARQKGLQSRREGIKTSSR